MAAVGELVQSTSELPLPKRITHKLIERFGENLLGGGEECVRLLNFPEALINWYALAFEEGWLDLFEVNAGYTPRSPSYWIGRWP